MTIAPAISATRSQVVGGAGRDGAEHELLRGAAAEQHRHVVDQLLARLQVAVLVGQVQRVAERPAARHDRDACTRSTAGSSSAHSAWPASWKATTRFSCSLSTRRDCVPAITRSSA